MLKIIGNFNMSTCQHYSARLISLHTEERYLYPSSSAICCRVLPLSRMARASSEVSFLVPTPLSAGTIFNTHTRHLKQRLKPRMQVSFLVPTPLSAGTIFNTHTHPPKQRLKPHMQVSFLVPTPLSAGTIFNTYKHLLSYESLFVVVGVRSFR